jgi:hypothetical protein
MNDQTVGAVLESFPEHQALAKKYTIWDFKVIGPVAMDDLMQVYVRVDYGKVRRVQSRIYYLHCECNKITSEESKGKHSI